MKKTSILSGLALSSVLLLSACGNGSTGNTDSVEKNGEIATSKAGAITAGEIVKDMPANDVARITYQKLMIDIAKDKFKGKVDEDAVKKKIEAQIKDFGGEEKFLKAIQNTSPAMTIKDFEQSAIDNAYVDKINEDVLNISDDKVKANSRNASQILIRTDKNAGLKVLSDKDAKKMADKILKEVKKQPEKFNEIIHKYEDKDGTSVSTGMIFKGQADKSIEEPLFALKTNEISNVIKSPYGYHIIKVNEMKDFDKIKDDVKRQYRAVLSQKNQDAYIKYYKKLFEDYKVKINDKNVKDLIESQYLGN